MKNKIFIAAVLISAFIGIVISRVFSNTSAPLENTLTSSPPQTTALPTPVPPPPSAVSTVIPPVPPPNVVPSPVLVMPPPKPQVQLGDPIRLPNVPVPNPTNQP